MASDPLPPNSASGKSPSAAVTLGAMAALADHNLCAQERTALHLLAQELATTDADLAALIARIESGSVSLKEAVAPLRDAASRRSVFEMIHRVLLVDHSMGPEERHFLKRLQDILFLSPDLEADLDEETTQESRDCL